MLHRLRSTEYQYSGRCGNMAQKATQLRRVQIREEWAGVRREDREKVKDASNG
jgi:hypothetical protein